MSQMPGLPAVPSSSRDSTDAIASSTTPAWSAAVNKSVVSTPKYHMARPSWGVDKRAVRRKLLHQPI